MVRLVRLRLRLVARAPWVNLRLRLGLGRVGVSRVSSVTRWLDVPWVLAGWVGWWLGSVWVVGVVWRWVLVVSLNDAIVVRG